MAIKLPLQPFGEWQYELRDKRKRLRNPLDRLAQMWDLANAMTVVNALRLAELLEAGEALSIPDVVAELPFFIGRNVEVSFTTAWPGTLTRQPTLLARCAITPADWAAFAPTVDAPYWRGAGGWEDLALLSDDRLIFYVCSHEKFGAIYGTPALFKSLDLHPRKVLDCNLYYELEPVWEGVVNGDATT